MDDADARRNARNSLPPAIRRSVPDPDLDAVHALAGELARATARGYLPGSHAYAALRNATARMPGGDLFPAVWSTYANHFWHCRCTQRDISRRIAETIKPLLDEHRPRNAILAEAHGVNGATGFWLTEKQCNDAAAFAVEQTLPWQPRRRRRG